MRFTPRHDCPPVAYTPAAPTVTVAGRSASSATISAPLSPSPKALRIMPIRPAIRCPTAAPPVNVTMSTYSQLTRASPTCRGSPVTSAIMPVGRPLSSSARTNSPAVSGVFSDDLTITLFPAAMAGTTFVTTWLSGRLNGVMAQISPRGSGMAAASLLAV